VLYCSAGLLAATSAADLVIAGVGEAQGQLGGFNVKGADDRLCTLQQVWPVTEGDDAILGSHRVPVPGPGV